MYLRQISKKLNYVILPALEFIIVHLHIRKSRRHYKSELLNISWWSLKHLEWNSFFISLYSNLPLAFPPPPCSEEWSFRQSIIHFTIQYIRPSHSTNTYFCNAKPFQDWNVGKFSTFLLLVNQFDEPVLLQIISFNLHEMLGSMLFYFILFISNLILNLPEPVFWVAYFSSILFMKVSFVAATEAEFVW